MAQPPPVRQIAEDSWERTHPIKTAPPVDLSWICQNASCSTSQQFSTEVCGYLGLATFVPSPSKV